MKENVGKGLSKQLVADMSKSVAQSMKQPLQESFAQTFQVLYIQYGI